VVPIWKPDVEFFQQALGFRIGNYGMTVWSDLFTPRQLVALTTFCDLVLEARELVKRDAIPADLSEDSQGLDARETGAGAYADAVATYLGATASKISAYHCSMGVWRPSDGKTGRLFGRQAISMVWDYPECNAVILAGFSVSGTWPMRTEQSAALKTTRNALASSIILVCHPRAADAPTATRREFVTAHKTELSAALAHLQRGNIAPVDLAQAAIGPGMAVYTRYA
jgi:adenine-specific DNA methylase